MTFLRVFDARAIPFFIASSKLTGEDDLTSVILEIAMSTSS
jgi:hypothetical protein